MNKRVFVLVCGLKIIVGCFFSGCASVQMTAEEVRATVDSQLNDSSRSLHITVASEPSGAKVYGLINGQAGSFLGTTPLVLKYGLIAANGLQYWGTAMEETLTIKTDESETLFDLAHAEITFRCIVMKPGYMPYKINQLIGKSKAWGDRSWRLTGEILKGNKTFTAFLQPTSETIAINANAQHQQTQANTHFTSGDNYYNSGDYGNAITSYSQGISFLPNHTSAYYMRGLCYYHKGDYDLAITDYNKAIQLKPEYVDAYINRGLCYYHKGDYDLAITDYNKAIQLDPRQELAYDFLANIYLEKGEVTEALNFYSKGIQRIPKSVLLYWNRGAIYSRQKRYLLADNDFEQAMQFVPDDEKANLFIDWAISRYRAGNNLDKIKSTFKSAWESDKRSVRIITNWALNSSQKVNLSDNKAIKVTEDFLLYPEDIEPLCKVLALCAPEHGIITLKQAQIIDPTLKLDTNTFLEVNSRQYARTAAGSNMKKAWAIVVGVSEYANGGQNGLTNLIYADDDAKEFANNLRHHGWSRSNIKLLTNEQATQRNVMIAMESWLTKAGPDDMVVLFWSGHGFPDPADPEKVYFACYDTDIRIPATGYRMDKVRSAVEELGVRNVVMFADTCHAGKLITRGDDKAIGISPYVNSLAKKNDVPKGWIFMVASDVDRKAIEDSSWSHGAFTYCLLKAMRGEADGYQSAGPEDGIVSMGELRAFMNSAMPDETQRILGVAKRPMITTSTGDPGIWDLSLKAR